MLSNIGTHYYICTYVHTLNVDNVVNIKHFGLYWQIRITATKEWRTESMKKNSALEVWNMNHILI